MTLGSELGPLERPPGTWAGAGGLDVAPLNGRRGWEKPSQTGMGCWLWDAGVLPREEATTVHHDRESQVPVLTDRNTHQRAEEPGARGGVPRHQE